jgi:ribonuclease HII
MRKLLLSTIASSLLFTTITVADTNGTMLTSKQVSQKATQDETARVEHNQVKLVQEAIKSLELSAKALKSLNENNPKEAKKNIELALGKLEAILSAEKTPKLLPIENRILVKNFAGTAKDVDTALEQVKKLLGDGKVQQARVLLSTLQSEIDVTVVSLPLISYPNALKLASKYLIEENAEKAKKVLSLALSTFTEVEQIIPIPIINSVELIATASRIAKENKEQALKHLEFASDELTKAEKLGYISSSTTTYKQLHEMIESVEKEIKGPNKAEALFKELVDKLKEFKEKILTSDEKSNSK